MSAILGPNGQPIQTDELEEEIVTTSLAGVRQPWLVDHIAGSIDPVSLNTILQSAAEGNAYDYLTLAEEMEEREPHYGSVLGTRKRAVTGLDVTVEAAGEDALSQKLADEIRTLVEAPSFGDMTADCLDALGKGYSAVSIDWETSTKQWDIRGYTWKDPRYFIYPQHDPYELRLYDESDLINGKPLPGYKFIIHRPRLKAGIPLRGGLARIAAVTYMCKSYTLKDWMSFVELFGLPMRIGRYGANAKPDQIKILKQAVANIGSDAAAVIPDSMRIDFQQVGNVSGGHQLFIGLEEWLDKQTSKIVLGQTMTADDGSSQSQANVHNEVRIDILKSDAKQLNDTLNRDLVRPYIDLNYGPQKHYPQIKLFVEELEDLELLANSLDKLVPLGLKVKTSEIRDKFGLSDPDEKDEVLTVGQAIAPALNHQSVALNAQANTDEIDTLAEQHADDWQPHIKPIVNDVNQLIDQLIADGKTLDDLRSALAQLTQKDNDKSIDDLTAATFKAQAIGDAD